MDNKDSTVLKNVSDQHRDGDQNMIRIKTVFESHKSMSQKSIKWDKERPDIPKLV